MFPRGVPVLCEDVFHCVLSLCVLGVSLAVWVCSFVFFCLVVVWVVYVLEYGGGFMQMRKDFDCDCGRRF